MASGSFTACQTSPGLPCTPISRGVLMRRDATRPDYEFTVGILRNGAREVEFRIEVDALGGKYSVTPSELLELKGRAAKLFSQAPGKLH